MQLSSGASRFLPSKRVGALVVIVGALIVSTVIFRSDASDIPRRPTARLTGEPQNITEQDTDGDGVKDWEESLWGLSEVSSDTDGDGVGDAQEVAEEQKRKEEERSGFISEAALLSQSASYAGLSETEKLSRGILEQVVAFQNAGISLDGKTTNDIASVLGNVLTPPPAPTPVVGLSDIKSVAESSASLAAYANALGTILGGKATSETNELLALAKFGETGDTGALDSLNAVVVTYDQIIRDLTNTPVPETLRPKHVALINSFSNTRESIALLSKLGSDPVKGIQGLQTYVSYSSSIATTFDSIRSYLRGRISLDTGEPGYIIIETTER